MRPDILIPLVLAAILTALFLTNEWSRGALADGLGLGHRTLFEAARTCLEPPHAPTAAHACPGGD